MGGSRNGDNPQNRWFIRENPTKMDDDWGYPYDLGNLHMRVSIVTWIPQVRWMLYFIENPIKFIIF